jgi:hypothetical protein
VRQVSEAVKEYQFYARRDERGGGVQQGEVP